MSNQKCNHVEQKDQAGEVDECALFRQQHRADFATKEQKKYQQIRSIVRQHLVVFRASPKTREHCKAIQHQCRLHVPGQLHELKLNASFCRIQGELVSHIEKQET